MERTIQSHELLRRYSELTNSTRAGLSLVDEEQSRTHEMLDQAGVSPEVADQVERYDGAIQRAINFKEIFSWVTCMIDAGLPEETILKVWDLRDNFYNESETVEPQ